MCVHAANHTLNDNPCQPDRAAGNKKRASKTRAPGDPNIPHPPNLCPPGRHCPTMEVGDVQDYLLTLDCTRWNKVSL